MDESLSWRAKLAKSNINILGVDDERWYYEFMYHPKPGQTKWCKTFYELPKYENMYFDESSVHYSGRIKLDNSPDNIAHDIQIEVRRIRKELEG